MSEAVAGLCFAKPLYATAKRQLFGTLDDINQIFGKCMKNHTWEIPKNDLTYSIKLYILFYIQ